MNFVKPLRTPFLYNICTESEAAFHKCSTDCLPWQILKNVLENYKEGLLFK